jgi:hypothetical protein
VRLRTTKTKGCLSRMTALTMVFKLCQSASRKWRRLDGSHQIAEIIQGVKFKDGEKLTERAARNLRHQLLTIAQRWAQGCASLPEKGQFGVLKLASWPLNPLRPRLPLLFPTGKR